MAETEGKKGAKVVFSGSPTEVVEAVGENIEASRKLAGKIASNGGTSEAKAPSINKLLLDASNIVQCTRTVPPPGTTMPDPNSGGMQRRLLSSVSIETPTSIKDIKDELDANLGGKDWMIAVYNNENQKVGGQKIRLNSAPKPVFEEEAPQQQDPRMAQFQRTWPMHSGMINGPMMNPMMGGMPQPMGFDPRFYGSPYARPPIGGDDDDGDDLDRRLKAIKVEEAEEDAKDRREQRAINRQQMGTDLQRLIRDEVGKVVEKISRIETDMSRFNVDFTRRLDSVERGVADKFTQVNAIFKDFQSEKRVEEANEKAAQDSRMRQVESAIDKSISQLSNGFSEIKAQLVQTQGGSNMMGVLSQMQGNFTNALTEMNKNVLGMAQARSEQPDSFDRFVQAFGAIAQFTGMGNFQGPQDPTTALINGMTESVPRVLQYLSEKQAAGQQITQEMIDTKIKEVAQSLGPTMVETVKSTVNTELSKRLPKKPPAITGPKTPASVPAPKVEAPVPTPEAKASPPPLKPPAVNVEEQKKLRVNGMIKAMLSEIDVMPGEAQWVEFALRYLPRDLMKQIAEMSNPMEVGAMLSRYADPSLKDALTAHLLDPEKQRWMGQQFTFAIEEFRAREAQAQGAPSNPDSPQ